MQRSLCLLIKETATTNLMFYLRNIWKSCLFQPIPIKNRNPPRFGEALYITSLLIIKDMITNGEPLKVAHLRAHEQMGTYIFLANTFEIALLVAV